MLHSYLYATSYIANVLGLRSLQEEASSFFFLSRVKARTIEAGDFPETHVPPVAPVLRREPANAIYSVMFLFLV